MMVITVLLTYNHFVWSIIIMLVPVRLLITWSLSHICLVREPEDILGYTYLKNLSIQNILIYGNTLYPMKQ
jgi:hypothetical protein